MIEVGATPDPAGPEPPGRRDRNRERLYEAALALFAERGHEATTMDDIAARAGLSRRSAFNHFPSKRDFTVEWSTRRRAAGHAIIGGEEPGRDVVDHVRAVFRAFAELTEANPDQTEQMTLAWLAAEGPVRYPTGTVAALRPWLAAGVRDGGLDPELDPALAADVLFDVYINVLCRWFASDDRDALVPRVDAAIDLVLRGLLSRR